LALVLVGAATVGAIAFEDLTSGLPAASGIESLFDPASGALHPTLFLDRTDQTTLEEPAETEPIAFETAIPDDGLALLIRATTAYFEPGFGEAQGTMPLAGLSNAVRHLGASSDRTRLPIAEQLIRQTLLPPAEHRRPEAARRLRLALMAADLERRYAPERILEWFFNSAYYGNGAYGPNAAAELYFGRSLDDLSLAQLALLAPIPGAPELNPFDSPQEAKARQADVLEALAREGDINDEAMEQAMGAPLRLRARPEPAAGLAAEFVALARQQLAAMLGPEFAYRGGLRVVTALDLDLQLQASCVMATQAARLSGEPPGTILPAADGSPCVAASLLAPVRPGDAEIDRGLDAAAVVILDATSGEVLSLTGLSREGAAWQDYGLGIAASAPRRAGPTLYPFIYLTAFATGYSPSSMTLDIPVPLDEVGTAPPAGGEARGPLRMRTALANGYLWPAARTVALLGAESPLRTARQMGLESLRAPPEADVGWVLEESRATLLDLARGLGIVASGGTMSGVEAPPSTDNGGALSPVLVNRVQDTLGRVLYSAEREDRAILSPQLAYLLADVLSDEPARWDSLGHPNVLEVGRPAGVVAGLGAGNADAWAIGFTPTRVVGTWMGTVGEEPASGVSPVGAAAPAWSALLRYAERDSLPAGWEMPPGMSVVEVCDPSGLLPTEYCPNVVREVFLQGTEPTHYDTLYQPFRVNRETGKLATLFTPLDLVEERIYLVPPAEAAAWAEASGIDRPPQEFDTITDQPIDPEVTISTPRPFQVLRGVVLIEGSAIPDGFVSYRLQYGQGLNPTRWVQVGDDESEAVEDGPLGRWDTTGLSGLHTLQLLVVREEGRVATAAVPVTIDNTPPVVAVLAPEEGTELQVPPGGEVVIEVEVADHLGVDRVEVFIDRRAVATLVDAPFSTRWAPAAAGEHTVFARAYDLAGNMTETEPVMFVVRR
jgi:membrane peptidoglycan carboxypeptidase